jgi:3-phytase
MRRTPLALGLVGLVVVGMPATATAAERHPSSTWTVSATTETPGLFDDPAGGDADADDPAIWIHPHRRDRSLVIGAAKNGGLRVYDLAGRERQAIATPPAPVEGAESGRFNNVDVVTGFRLGGATVDLAVVTDRGRDQLRIYRIDPVAATAGRPPLVDVTVADAPLLFSRDQAEVADQATGYGLATYSAGGNAYAAVSRRHRTRLGLFALVDRGGRVGYRRTDLLDLPASFRLPNGSTWTPCAEPGEDPQVEGMVVDAETGVLYAGQEDVGLWRIGLRTRAGRFGVERHIVERVAEYGVPATYDPQTEECTADSGPDPKLGGRIHADVEGATIYDTGNGRGYLLVSSQGDSRFYVYDRRTNAPVASFMVGDGPRTDGAQHSDGAAATSVSLPGYPAGLLVVHDGENTPEIPGADGAPRPNTNFKFVDWRALHLR